jgi:putative transposase
MPRIARALVDNGVYHLLNRGNRRQVVFNDHGDYRAFIELIRVSKEKYGIHLLAYCLMPNHFHLVVQPERGAMLSSCMQWLMTSHVRYYHTKRRSSGHIWQGRYKSFIIQRDEHLLTVLRYVERNPVRAGLVSAAADWTWSSHLERCGEGYSSLLDPLPVDLPKNWASYVSQPLSLTELETLRLNVARQAPYGSEAWQQKVSTRYGLQATLRPRGRPSKKHG